MHLSGWTTPISLRGDDPAAFEQEMKSKECDSVKCSGTTIHKPLYIGRWGLFRLCNQNLIWIPKRRCEDDGDASDDGVVECPVDSFWSNHESVVIQLSVDDQLDLLDPDIEDLGLSLLQLLFGDSNPSTEPRAWESRDRVHVDVAVINNALFPPLWWSNELSHCLTHC